MGATEPSLSQLCNLEIYVVLGGFSVDFSSFQFLISFVYMVMCTV